MEIRFDELQVALNKLTSVGKDINELKYYKKYLITPNHTNESCKKILNYISTLEKQHSELVSVVQGYANTYAAMDNELAIKSGSNYSSMQCKYYSYKEAPQHQKSFWEKTSNQVLLGDFTDDVTWLGTAINIAASIVGVDAPMDARDFAANVQKGHWGWALIDAISLIPVIGFVGETIKGGKNTAKTAEAVGDTAQLIKSSGKVASKTDEVVELGKNTSKSVDSVGSTIKTSYGKSSGKTGADNIADAAKLKEYYKQAEKYGTGSIKELENGRFRLYEELIPARTQGEMAGARHVREWNPYTGLKRDWYETLDYNGIIRQVRPDPNITGGVKVHYMFDAEGDYIGNWIPKK